MALLDRLLSRAPEPETRDISANEAWARDIVSGNTTAAGVNVTQDNALNYVTVYACVRLIAESIASLPIDTFQKVKGENRSLRTPLWLDQPNIEMTRFEFIERCLGSLLLWGNAYIYVVRDLTTGAVVELWPINPAAVTVERDEANNLRYVVDGKPVPTGVVLHIKAFPNPTSPLGLSPVAVGRQAIAAGMATDTYAAKFWANGASPQGLLTLEGQLDDTDRKQLEQAWNNTYGSANKAHKTAVLSGGAKYTPITMPAEDSQFLQTRSFQVDEIARLFRVPPHKIGDLTRSTFSNIEHQAIEFVVDTLRPWMVRLELSLSGLLLPSQYVKFNERALLRGDTKSQAEALHILWQDGAINHNEMRDKLELESISEGDTYYVPLNMAPVDAANEPKLTDKASAYAALVNAGVDPNAAASAVGFNFGPQE